MRGPSCLVRKLEKICQTPHPSGLTASHLPPRGKALAGADAERKTAQQYHDLYIRACARLADIHDMTERAMGELEELELKMGDAKKASP